MKGRIWLMRCSRVGVLLWVTGVLVACASTGLHRAVQDGNTERVEKKLAAVQDLDRNDRTGRTLLSLAAENGHDQVVRQLVAAGADVEVRDISAQESGAARPVLQQWAWRSQSALEAVVGRRAHGYTEDMTPLAVASQANQRASAEALLAAGADIESRNTDQALTPLLLAAGLGYRDLSEYLLARGADPLARDALQQTALSLLANNAAPGPDADIMGTAAVLMAAIRSLHPAAVARDVVNHLGEVPRRPSALHAAAAHDNLPLVEWLLAQGARTEVTDARGGTPLFEAAEAGHASVVAALLAARANANATGEDGLMALTLAAAAGHGEIVTQLLRAGARPGGSGDINTPLIAAVSAGHLEIARQLLDAGATPNTVMQSGLTPLLVAVEHNQEAMVQALLEAGARPDLVAPGSNTALQRAVAARRPALAQRLLAARADPNRVQEEGKAWVPLQVAIEQDHLELTAMLLEAGANPNPGRLRSSRPLEGPSPLAMTALNHREGLMQRLLAAGAEVNEQWAAEPDQLTALLVAVRDRQGGMVRRLLEAGADPNLGGLGEEQWRALHLAADRQDAELLAALLAAGAKPDVVSATSLRTPLHTAVLKNDVAMVRALLAAGADPDLRTGQGHTALRLAVAAGNKALVDLLAGKANPDLADNDGFTPLYLAIQLKRPDLARSLLEARANPNLATTTGGWTPLHKAALDDYMEGYRLLVAAGADRSLRNQNNQTADDIIRARQERLAQQRAAEEAERQRKAQQRAAFMGALFETVGTIAQEAELERQAQAERQRQHNLLLQQAAEQERQRQAAANAEAEARRQQQVVAYNQQVAQAQSQAQQAQAAREAELRRQEQERLAAAQAAERRRQAEAAEANRQRQAEERRQAEEQARLKRQQEREQAARNLVSGLSARAVRCDGSYLIQTSRPSTSGCRVSFEARCPGTLAGQGVAVTWSNFIGGSCLGVGDIIRIPGSMSCPAEQVIVDVTGAEC
ncbi:ankyrin repeat domain-containing protein [Isoalcanivorax indicus]|uniref:ankyrin repeat domain-containing protein n=1 Tax=Isoalcanivorax indicus TaxID=2202653 RepID=UPI0013C45039|nr:ankyrin repeat domain-containing protein [Isoalcanivorax indicus]